MENKVLSRQELLWHWCIHSHFSHCSLVLRLLWFCWCGWCFSSLSLCLCHFLQAYPEFVLTYLEELNEREKVTQTENHIHHEAWAAAHQEIDSSSAEEVTVLSQRQVTDSPFKNTFWKEKYHCGSLFPKNNKKKKTNPIWFLNFLIFLKFLHFIIWFLNKVFIY